MMSKMFQIALKKIYLNEKALATTLTLKNLLFSKDHFVCKIACRTTLKRSR